jgi:hypothetical protein
MKDITAFYCDINCNCKISYSIGHMSSIHKTSLDKLTIITCLSYLKLPKAYLKAPDDFCNKASLAANDHTRFIKIFHKIFNPGSPGVYKFD